MRQNQGIGPTMLIQTLFSFLLGSLEEDGCKCVIPPSWWSWLIQEVFDPSLEVLIHPWKF